MEYSTFQFQDNFTYYAGAHTITAGINIENLSFTNVFFPGSQSVYVYNSLADFYTDANDYIANPGRTASPISLRRFQLRYSALPGGAEPVQPSEVLYTGIYAQDEFEPMAGLKLTAGLRMDIPIFSDTGYENPNVNAMTFIDPSGNPYTINTEQLPKSKALISPRLGFNYDVMGDKTLQVRGGTGVFTGRPVFVWISNQVGNNGVLTGFESIDNTTTRPFVPDATAYVPSSATLPSSVEIAATDPDFKFPQTWRSNIAVDKKLPWWGLVGTLEYIYSQDVNGMTYFNANLPLAQTSFSGPDGRPRWTSNRLNVNVPNVSGTGTTTVTSAEVLANTDRGYSSSFAIKLEKPIDKGFFATAAYNFGNARNTIDPGSIARGSWQNNAIYNDPNNPRLDYSANDQRHRAIVSLGYRKEYAGKFASQIGIFWEGRNQGRFSYITSNDMNGDGGFNDLIYVARDQSEMLFETHTPTGASAPYTAAQQAADWDAFIAQDEYLSGIRGGYADRNGALIPWVFRADFSFVQDFFMDVKGKRNTLQFRVDIINVGNLLNDSWGVGNVVSQARPLNYRGVTSNVPRYRLNIKNVDSSGNVVPFTETFTKSASLDDVWQMQFSLRYIFN